MLQPAERMIAVLGGMGLHPLSRLSLPARRLLAYLAIKGKAVSRSAAAGELWPDCPEEASRANLRRALWQVPTGWIDAAADALHLEAATDIERARLAAATALRGEPIGFDDIALLSNEILPGWHEDRIVAAQDSFHLLRVQALEAACRTLAARGDHALAIQAGAAAMAAEPLSESAAEALIAAHLGQHNRYQALLCFRGLAERLNAELGVAPDPELAAKVGACAMLSRLAS